VLNRKDGVILPCTLKGRFKLDYRLKKDKLTTKDVVVVGDAVIYELNKDSTGVITEVLPRKNFISRKAPRIKGSGKRGERMEQVLVANIDQFFCTVSVDKPEFNNKTLDRFLVIGESAGLKPIIVINKSDLIRDEDFLRWAELYQDIGYDVFLTNKFDTEDCDELRELLVGKISLFWGTSGVGKSSLINKLFPELALREGEISGVTNKGRHTTVTVQMIDIGNDSFVIDTPGVREVDPFGITNEDLCHYFTEFKPYMDQCRFSRCIHQHEPGCAVIEAVEEEKISVERYDSYLRLLATIEEDLIF
jgi:ribosome biogenesis GTPase